MKPCRVSQNSETGFASRWSWVGFLNEKELEKRIELFPGLPSLHWRPNFFLKKGYGNILAVRIILTTSPTECQLVYKNTGAIAVGSTRLKT